MILKDLICPCGYKDYISLFKGTKKSPKLNYPLNFSILKCKKCGLARTYPIPYKGNVKYEDPEQASKYIENETITNKDVFTLSASDILQKIEEFKRAGRLLDVGSGACILLDLARNKGWDTYGVELSKVHCQYAQSIGLSVRNSTIADAGFPDGYFDVVSMIHILEHVIDPIKDLCEVKRVLKDDGIIVIDTPNIGTLIAKIQRERYLPLQPDCHVWQFTPTTLTNLLARAGFTSIRVLKHSRNFRYLVLLCMLSVPTQWMSRAGRLRIFLRFYILFKSPLRKIIKNSITVMLCLLCRIGVCCDSICIIARKTTNFN